jgi:hypothetical protein
MNEVRATSPNRIVCNDDYLITPMSPVLLDAPSRIEKNQMYIENRLKEIGYAREQEVKNYELFAALNNLHKTFFKTLQHENIFPSDAEFEEIIYVNDFTQLKILSECSQFSNALDQYSHTKEKYKKVIDTWGNVKLRSAPAKRIKHFQSIIDELNQITQAKQLKLGPI